MNLVHIECLIDGFGNDISVCVEAEVVQHVSGRVQHGDGVGNVEAGHCCPGVTCAGLKHSKLKRERGVGCG